jgi:hypothetical protein
VAALAPLIWAPKPQPQEAAFTIPDPPPHPLKGRKAGGGGPEWPSAPLIRARSSGPSERCAPDSGPPPSCLKVERQGGVRNLLCAADLGAQIWTARSCLLFTTGALSLETLDKWVLPLHLHYIPPIQEISLTMCGRFLDVRVVAPT